LSATCENILLKCELGNFSAKIFVFAQKILREVCENMFKTRVKESDSLKKLAFSEKSFIIFAKM
jgi:hypothetical protein